MILNIAIIKHSSNGLVLLFCVCVYFVAVARCMFCWQFPNDSQLNIIHIRKFAWNPYEFMRFVHLQSE